METFQYHNSCRNADNIK